MKIENLVDVPEQEYSLHLTDYNADTKSYGADTARDANYRYQTEQNNVPKAAFFGKMQKPEEQETTYTSGGFRAAGRFFTELGTLVPAAFTRAWQEGVIQPSLNLYDMAGWYSLDSELDDYKKSVGFDNMTPVDKAKFIKTDSKFLDIQNRMREKSQEISMRTDPKFTQQTNELYNNLKKSVENFEEGLGIAAKETDSQTVNELFAGASSLVEFGVICYLTKNPAMAAAVAGLQQGAGLYEEARQSGVDVDKAMGIATAGGAIEGILEKWGLHKLAENITTKTLFRAAGKSFLTESIQEASQQAGEEAIMYKIRSNEGMKDKVIRIVKSAIYGGILGSMGSVVSRPFVLQHAKNVHNELVQNGVEESRATELVNQAINGTEAQKESASHDIQVALESAQFQQMGLSQEEAENLAEKFSVTNQEFKDEVIDSLSAELDPSTYEGGTLESGIKFFDENFNKSVLAEDFDITEDVKKEAVEGGMNEEQANLLSTAVDAFAKTMYNKTGITPREAWEDEGALHLMIKDERPNVEDMEDEDIEKASPEERKVWDDGSYEGEDGFIHDKDGKVLFQGPASLKKVDTDTTSLDEKRSKNKEYNDKAVAYFGKTYNLAEAGYIMTDGNLLDLSGKKFGGQAGMRNEDHRTISRAFEETGYDVEMEDFINSGNIRYMPEGNKLLMSNYPTQQQFDAIKRVVSRANGYVTIELMSDANKWGMNPNDFYMEYEEGTSFNRIKRDIDAFYKGSGVSPEKVFYQSAKAVTTQKEYNPRENVPSVRGGWTKEKIIKYLKENPSNSGVAFATRRIAEFNSVEDLKEHMFYHGSKLGTSGRMKPSILFSDKEMEMNAGGGYGERYWSISVSKSKRVAGTFATASGDGMIYPVILVKNANVIEMPELSDSNELDEHIVELYNKGIDAVWIGDKNKGEQELAVINPKAIVNIGTPDFYKAYGLGSVENPIRIKFDEDIKDMFDYAKDIVRRYPKTMPDEVYDEARVRVFFQFIGEKAAKLDPILQERLEKAQDMSSQPDKYTMDDIRDATGWFLGPDMMWRYEISDEDAKFAGKIGSILAKMQKYEDDYSKFTKDLSSIKDPKVREGVREYERLEEDLLEDKTNEYYKLTDVMQHDELYRLYPGLKKYNVIFKKETGGENGSVEGWNIILNASRKPSEIMKTLFHEVQHVLQQIEDFARGGSPYEFMRAGFLNAPEDIQNKLDERQKITDKLYKELSETDVVKTDIVKGYSGNINPEYIGKYVKDLNKLAQHNEETGLGKSLSEDIKRYNQLNDELKEWDRNTPFAKYRRLYGEIEARNTAERLDMTSMLRKMIAPELTQDVATDDAIILKQVEGERIINQEVEEPRGVYKHTLNEKILDIFKNGDASTVVHELGHYFTINYLEALQMAGQEEEAREVMNWLGVSSIDELLGDSPKATEALEKLARGFETYVMTTEAPTSRLKEFFERFKNWMLKIYDAIAPEEINDDVRAFFDKMLAADEVNVSEVMRLAENKQALREVVQQALSGKAVEIGGIKIDDIKELVKVLNARVPKKVKTLRDYLKDIGINEEFAKKFDIEYLLGVADLLQDSEKLRELKKKNLITQKQINEAKKLITKEGGIEREDELIDWLHSLGFLQGETETYGDTSALWDEALNLLENADRVYTPEGEAMAEQRQAILDAVASAEEALSGIDYKSLMNAIKTLSKNETVGVQKEALKYIKEKQNDIDKGYKKLLKQMLKAQKKDLQSVRDAVVDFIREQPILEEDKSRLMGFIKKANSMNTLQKLSEQIRNKAMEYYDKEQRKELNRAIQKEIRQTKPYTGGEQRYDYENNKLFQELRKYNRLSREKAGEELAKLPMDEDAIADLSETDLIKRRFLSYKAGGADASQELMTQVLKDIVDAKEKGKQAKNEEEHEKMVNMENDRQELIKVLDESKADPKKLSDIIQNKYRSWITSLYSMLNSIFGKNIADKYQLEVKQTNVNARIWKKTAEAIHNIARILNVKGRTGVIDEFTDMARKKYTITDAEGLHKEIDVFGIIDIYNAIKNSKTKRDYYNAFGEEQVNGLVNTLTVQERALGDYMMQEVNSYYNKLNDVYVKLYGIDLPKVENYWPATSEHKDSVDIQGDYFQQTTIPSALKERSRGKVIPIPKNAWQKFNKHIAEAEYISGLGLDYMNIKKIFKSRRIKSKLIEKYGEPVYQAIMSDIESLSMASKIQEIDEVNNTFQKILGNTVLAKIAVGIPVFVKQLTSCTNYAVDMPVKLWAKDFAAGLAHPKETVKYMMDNAPFLKARFGQGYNEALARVIRDANKMSGKKVAWTEAMSSFTRYGDIGAIIFGGYPYMKYLKNTGVEDAAEKFEFSTLRSQQSGTPVSLSPFQRSRGMMQIFQAFNNTPMQYMRMIYDAIYQYKNGDITAQQMGKQLFNFGIIQPALYVLAGIYANKMINWNNDDDDDNTIAQIVKQIVLNPIDGIPVFSDFIGAVMDRLIGEKNYGMKPVLISDIDKAFSKLNKKELDVWDVAEIITPIVEGMTAAPMGRVERILKKNFKD